MRSRIGVLFLAVFLVSGLANAYTGEYEGSGTWESADGQTGTWSSEMEVLDKGSSTFEINEMLTIRHAGEPDVVEKSSLQFVFSDHGNFDVIIDGTKTGSGVCSGHECSMTSAGRTPGSTWGETFKFGPGKFYREGYDSSPQFSVKWQGWMYKS